MPSLAEMLGGKQPKASSKSSLADSLMRKPYQSELDYFRANPNVGGMATEDSRVILNPYSNLSPDEQAAVAENEAARVYMKSNTENAPTFELTPEQSEYLGTTTYVDADESDRRATIAARILSGDPSAGTATPEQSEYVNRLRMLMMGGQ